jgi:hypothetical protein
MATSYRGHAGITLQLGDRVTLATLDGSECIEIPVGSTGTLAEDMGGGNQCIVHWDLAHRSFHTGHGSIPDKHGWTVNAKCLAMETVGVLDKSMQSLVDALSTTGQYLIVNGVVFALTDTALKAPSEMLKRREDQLIYTFQQKLTDLRNTEIALKARYERMLLMPNISASQLAAGIMCYADSNIHICRAIKYAPKFIHKDGVDRELSNDDVATLARTVLADVTIPNFSIALRHLPGMSQFSHYHGMGGNDCTGSLDIAKYASGDKDSLVARVIRFITDYESLLTTINASDLANRRPEGLPEASSLLGRSLTIGAADGHLSIHKPPAAAPLRSIDRDDDDDDEHDYEDDGRTTPRFSIEDRVIITDWDEHDDEVGIHDGMIGTICSDADDWEDELGWTYGVRFDEHHDNRHDCDGECTEGHGYYVRESYLARLRPIADETPVRPFRIGDRIVMTGGRDAAREGDIGIIVANRAPERWSVDFERMSPEFHDCQGTARMCHGHNVRSGDMRLLNPMIRVSDRITMIANHDAAQIGDTGTVVSITSSGALAVAFDVERLEFHDCDTLTPSHHGHWVDMEDVVLIAPIMYDTTPATEAVSAPSIHIPQLTREEIEGGVLSI